MIISGFATINPVAASPMLGFGTPPSRTDNQPPIKLSIIDFHGILDTIIPYMLETSEGFGPHNSYVSSVGGFYFEDKQTILRKWAKAMECSEIEEKYLTGLVTKQTFHNKTSLLDFSKVNSLRILQIMTALEGSTQRVSFGQMQRWVGSAVGSGSVPMETVWSGAQVLMDTPIHSWNILTGLQQKWHGNS